MDGMQQWPAEAIRLIKQLQQDIEKLKKEVADLKNRLKVYESPHTPPSQQRFKDNTGGTNSPGRRGAPPGHHGATRTHPETVEIIPVAIDTCSRCGSYLGAVTKVESRIIEDLPPPQHIRVTRYDLHHYHCPGCGTDITVTHPDCPHTGYFGVLAIKPLKPDETITIEQERMLHSFASLAALATSRIRSVNQQA